MLHMEGQLTHDTVEDLAVLAFVKIASGYGMDHGSFLIFWYRQGIAGTRSKFRTVIVLVQHYHL